MTQNTENQTENTDTPEVQSSKNATDGQTNQQQKKKPKKKREKKIVFLGLIILINLMLFSVFLVNYLKNRTEYDVNKSYINQNIPKNIDNVEPTKKVFAEMQTSIISPDDNTPTVGSDKPLENADLTTTDANEQQKPSQLENNNNELLKSIYDTLPNSKTNLNASNTTEQTKQNDGIDIIDTKTQANAPSTTDTKANNTTNKTEQLNKDNQNNQSTNIKEKTQTMAKQTAQTTKKPIPKYNPPKVSNYKTAEQYGVYYTANQQNYQPQNYQPPQPQPSYQPNLNVEDVPQNQPNEYQAENNVQANQQNNNDAVLMSFDVPKNQGIQQPPQLAEIKQEAEMINDQLRTQINAVRQRNQQKIEKEQKEVIKNTNPLDDW